MKFMKGWKNFLSEEVDTEGHTKTFPARPSSKQKPDEYHTPHKDEYAEPKSHSREKYFGKNPDHIQCVIDHRGSSPRKYRSPEVFYDCMAEDGYEFIGAGSFRAVLGVPGKPELVLKIVSPRATDLENKKLSMNMNRQEAEGGYQTASEMVPRTYDSARDHFWIISEKVVVIKTWHGMIEFFPSWVALLKDGIFESWQSGDEFKSIFYELIARSPQYNKVGYAIWTALAAKHNLYDLNGEDAERMRMEIQERSDEHLEQLKRDSMFANLRDLLAKFDLPAWDIRPHNVGYVTRGGRKQFVVLDPGFELGEQRGTLKGQESDDFDIQKTGDIFKDQEKYAQTWESPPVNTKIPATQYENKIINETLNRGWRLFLENKGPSDFIYDISKSPDKITINLLDSETEEPVESKKEGTNAFISLEKRTNVPNWEVSWSSSPSESDGVGTIMYLMALELAEEGLAPDSYETSPDALRIWEKFMNENEYGVEKELKDGHEGEDETDPFNFVFFKPEKSVLGQYSTKITEKEAKSEEIDDFDPEKEEKVQYFDPEQFNWEELDDIDELYENLTKNDDTDEVSKVIIADDSGKILILKRSDKENKWDLPGGHLKGGENAEDGAFRETKEETNLDISDLSALNTHENTHFYKCAAPKGDIQLKKDEHNDFMWVNPKEIDKYDMKKHLKDAIFSAFDVIAEQNEPYQRFSKGTYRKFIAKLAKQGKNKYNVGGVMEKPSTKHLKSGPPGA
jgi:8-oxo-dGTP pyrophosphatase MutT (NUDIX family)